MGFTGATIGLGQYSRGPVRRELIDTVDASLTDTNPNNDIDRSMVADMCAAARRTPDGASGGVTNPEVVTICNRGERLATAGMVTGGLMIASFVSTAVFTTLLFVHRPGAKARARARRTHWAVGPTPAGAAFTMSGSF